jgi:UDPglucose--hexose-1-phosphate uridylyltransferase
MAELRWNPLLDTYTMVATNRQHRPHMPNNWCAFCPGEGKKVPDSFDVFSYPNDFPVLSQKPDTIESHNTSIVKNKKAYGKCEVLLYSPKHDIKLYELSEEHILKLVELWTSRFVALAKDKKIKYIFEFENRGEEVGVTMPHPHGQLYAYSWIPFKIKSELDNCKKYFTKHKRNLFEDLNQSETAYKKRVVAENEDFIAYIPYFTDYPFGVFIVAKNNLLNFSEFNTEEMQAFGNMLLKAAYQRV